MDAITKDSPEWLAALKWVPEKWNSDNYRNVLFFWLPDITPDLLYAILEAGLKYDPYFIEKVETQRMKIIADRKGRTDSELRDAIIRAAASFQEAK